MANRQIAGVEVEFNEEGFMVDRTQWNRDIAVELAKEQGIDELTDRHFAVIEFMRSAVEEKGTAPTIRRLTKESGVPTKELYALFPGGPAKKAALIGGLTKPQGCV